MARIRNSVGLDDNTSSVLDNINTHAQALLKTFGQLNTATANFGQNLNANQITPQVNQITNNIINLNERVTETAVQSERARESLQGMSTVKFAVLIRALKQIRQLLTGITDTVDELTTSLAVIDSYNFSGVAIEEFAQYLYDVSKATRTELQQTASIAQDLLSTGIFRGENASIQAIQTTELINKAVIGSGTTGKAAEQAATQLTNALARGELSALNITTLLRTSPKFVDYLAQGFNELGYTVNATRYDIRDLANDGEVTADRVVRALHAASEVIQSDFEQMPITFSQVYASFSSTWQYVLLQLNRTDGPLQNIMTQLIRISDWLASSEAVPFWSAVGVAIDIVAFALEKVLDLFGLLGEWIRNNEPIVIGFLSAMAVLLLTDIAIGIANAIRGFIKMGAAAAATHPVIAAVALLVGVLSYAFIQAGNDAEDLFGAIGWGVGWIGEILGEIVVGLTSTIGNLLFDISKAVATATGVIAFAFDNWELISQDTAGFIVAVFKDAFTGLGNWLYDFFFEVGDFLVSIVQTLGKGVDALFGTNVSSSIGNWRIDQRRIHEDTNENFWRAAGGNVDRWANETLSAEDLEIWNENWDRALAGARAIGDTQDDFNEWIDSVNNLLDELPDRGEEFGRNAYNVIKELLDQIDLNGSRDDLDDILSKLDDLDLTEIDRVGVVDEIRNDVNIADEDLRLLKDIASDKYRNDLRYITVDVDMEFGDINNMGDIEDIYDHLADQLEEKVASTLIS